MKNLHIVFRHSDRTLLDSGLFDSKDDAIFKLSDQLQIGPINALTTKTGIQFRKKWLEHVFGDSSNLEAVLNAVEADMVTISKVLEMANSCHQIYIWTGRYVSEIIGTCRLIHAIISCNKPIFVLDFSNVCVLNVYGDVVRPKSLLQTDPSQIKDVFEHFKIQDNKDIQTWSQRWGELQLVDSTLRVLGKNGEICHQNESFFDEKLFFYLSDKFQPAALVIGHTLVDIDFSVGDEFLNCRLKEMVKANKIEYSGQLNAIRDYQVKKISASLL